MQHTADGAGQHPLGDVTRSEAGASQVHGAEVPGSVEDDRDLGRLVVEISQ